MPRQVTFDTVDILYGLIRVQGEQVLLDIGYQVQSSREGVVLEKRRDVSALLTPQEVETILRMAARVKQALEAEELA